MSDIENRLAEFTGSDWLTAIETILPEIHKVDREAVQIWFRFFPLELQRFLQAADDRDEAVRGLALQGDWDLVDQIDTSHHFLYGHRYWKKVKCVIEKESRDYSGDNASLVDMIKAIGMSLSEKLAVERPLVNAIAAIGLMTLNQVGFEAFSATPGETVEPSGLMKRSPDAIVAEREKDDSQGIFGFLKTVNKKYSVDFAGAHIAGKFPIISDEEIASASQKDHSRDWQSMDERCWQGPVPVECTAASCGTCWVGVLGGSSKLSEVARRERRQMKVFGYNQPDGPRPFLRLACQARAEGNATIVIPPWNGVFGKKVYNNVEEIELEPATTSAKHLRETIASAGSGEN